MKTFKEILNESKIGEIISSPESFLKWIDQFPKSGKAPRGMKKQFRLIKNLQHFAKTMREYGMMNYQIMYQHLFRGIMILKLKKLKINF